MLLLELSEIVSGRLESGLDCEVSAFRERAISAVLVLASGNAGGEAVDLESLGGLGGNTSTNSVLGSVSGGLGSFVIGDLPLNLLISLPDVGELLSDDLGLLLSDLLGHLGVLVSILVGALVELFVTHEAAASEVTLH